MAEPRWHAADEAPGAGTLALLEPMAARLLQPMLEAMPARVAVLDADDHILFANRAFMAFAGIKPEYLIGGRIDQLIGATAYAAYQPARDLLERGQAACFEGWMLLAGVGARYMREHLVPIGPGLATLVISLDWTDLKRQQEALQAKVAELEATRSLKAAIVDHAQTAIVVADADDRLIEFNPAAERLLGWRRDEILGQSMGECLSPPHFLEAYRRAMARLRAGQNADWLGRPLQREVWHRDGHAIPVEMQVWFTQVQGAAHFTVSMSDRRAQIAAQQLIEQQREALRQSEKLGAMGSLLAGVAHELNNPLAIVMGRATLLEEATAGTPMQADAERVRVAAERCGRIVKTFLSMARQRPAQRQAVRLHETAQAAAELVGYTLRSHAIQLELRLDPTQAPAQVDPDAMGQSLLNLLVNAQQALATVEGPRRIVISNGQDAHGLWLRVQDNGPGVPAELRESIFDPFFTTKPEGSGTGVGLSVSRAMLREQGGELSLLDTHPGACFEIRVPLPSPLP
ncbi:MAG: PAS domain S-box protein [Burkholderiales bacterium]|nr:PAS domain S-box protein [Burkholderiales bacterium]